MKPDLATIKTPEDYLRERIVNLRPASVRDLPSAVYGCVIEPQGMGWKATLANTSRCLAGSGPTPAAAVEDLNLQFYGFDGEE